MGADDRNRKSGDTVKKSDITMPFVIGVLIVMLICLAYWYFIG